MDWVALTEGLKFFVEEPMKLFAEGAILMFEWIGVIVLVVAGIMGVVNCIRHHPETRLKLAQGLAMGLEFKLGGEILRTVLVRDLSEIAVVGTIILLRAALTFLIHWEIKNEEQTVSNQGFGDIYKGDKHDKHDKTE